MSYNWDAIKSRVDMLRLVSASVEVKRAGGLNKACCPFHDERTPSFVVYDDHAHCFGCAWHGDAVDFVMGMNPSLTHAEAVDYLGEGASQPLSAPEKKRMAARREQQEKEQSAAIEEARLRWVNASPLPESGHPYLERKGVTPRHDEVRLEGINLLVPVYDAKGEIVSVQSIPPADGSKLFHKGAPVGEGRLNIGIALGRVICCEGYATGCSVFAAMPDQVRVSFSKDGIKKRIAELLDQGIDCAIAADRKGIDDIIEFAAPRGVPVFVPPDPHDDFNDLEQAEGTQAVANVLRGKPIIAPTEKPSPEPEPEAANDDSDPVDVWSRNAPPTLPKGQLPSLIERFALIRSQMIGADAGALAMSALAVCAAAIPDSISIKVKQHEDWREEARLWVMLVGDPSSKKSPIMRAAAKRFSKMDTDALREHEAALAQWQADKKDGIENPKPLETRLRMEDTTMESAQEICRNSPDGVLALQDELSGWFGGIEKYAGGKGGAKDRSFWLRAYNGGEYAVSRVGRGSYIIDNLSVSILGGIQPDAIRRIMADATDDGLIQRFLPVIVPSAGADVDEALPDVAREYDELVVRLRSIEGPTNMFGPVPLTFDAGARAVREELAEKHRGMVTALESLSKKFAAHIGKFDGIFPRLCLIWHCIQNANVSGSIPPVITEDTARRCADFLHGYILGQSKAFYHGIINISEDQDQIEDVAGYILAHEVEAVTPRTFSRGSTRMRKFTRQHMEPIVQQLEALGWLESVDMKGDKFSCKVNPRVHEVYRQKAEEERVRRAQNVDTIRKLVGR